MTHAALRSLGALCAAVVAFVCPPAFAAAPPDMCEACSANADCAAAACVGMSNGSFCTTPCGTGTSVARCPNGYHCTLVGSTKYCMPTTPCAGGTPPAAEGESCASSAACAAGLVCVGSGTAGTAGTCRASCNPAAPACAAGKECASLSGGGGACVPATGGTTGGDLYDPCGETGECRTGLVCVGTSVDNALCLTACNPSAPACPAGESCEELLDGGGVCVEGGGGSGGTGEAGDPCASSDECAEGLLCVGTSAADAACRTECSPANPFCDAGEQCVPLNNGAGACLPGGGGTGGSGAGDPCGDTGECGSGLVCVGTSADDAICLAECDPAAPACADDETCEELVDGGGVCVPGYDGGTDTEPRGLGGQGVGCSSDFDCVAGLYCASPDGGATICVTDCDPDAPSCPYGLACNPWPASLPAGSAGGYCFGTEGGTGGTGTGGTGGSGGVVGGSRGENAACTANAQCASGLACVADSAGGATQCRRVCVNDGVCGAGAKCLSAGGGVKVCRAVASGTADTNGLDSDGVGSRGGCAGAGPVPGLTLLALPLVARRRRARG